MFNRKMPVCANCKKNYTPGDRYCRFCGAPMGEPEFINDNYARIYGPRPITRQHQCKICGYTWETYLMADDQRFCPICGGEAPVKTDD